MKDYEETAEKIDQYLGIVPEKYIKDKFCSLVEAAKQAKSDQKVEINTEIMMAGMEIVKFYRKSIISEGLPVSHQEWKRQKEMKEMLYDMCHLPPIGMDLPLSLKIAAGQAIVDILVSIDLLDSLIDEILKGKMPAEVKRYGLDNVAPLAKKLITRYYEATGELWEPKPKISYILMIARWLDRLKSQEEAISNAREHALECAIRVFEKEGNEEVMKMLQRHYSLPKKSEAAQAEAMMRGYRVLKEFEKRLEERKKKHDGELVNAKKFTDRPVTTKKQWVERIRFEILPKKGCGKRKK